jgi:hypothetical protein
VRSAGLIALVAVLALPPSASANHVPGATYEGEVTTGQGGDVTLTVSGDGTTVEAEFQGLGNVSGTCTGVGFSTGPVPITNHSFTYTSPSNLVTANGTFGPSSVNGGAQVLTTPCTTGSQAWRVVEPDMVIEKPEELGLDVFNPSGSGQTVTLNGRRGESHSVSAGVVNAGTDADSFRVKGCGPAKGVKPTYRGLDQVDITDEVRSGSYETGDVAPSDFSRIDLNLKVTQRAKPGKTFTCKVTADSGRLVDTIKAKLEVKRGQPRPD